MYTDQRVKLIQPVYILRHEYNRQKQHVKPATVAV